MEDRYSAYSNPHYINRPAKSRRKEKYWIYLTIACLFLLLTGIVFLVVFLIPKHKLPYAGMNTKWYTAAERTTISPKDYHIDPRSDFADNEHETDQSGSTSTSTASNPVNSSFTQNPESSLPASPPRQNMRPNDRFNTTFWELI